uniref:Uncharacterized protein n=2 Tax=viral metagenome TaxID=1070528 RepID=A0A6M3XGB1_9ZZZZ
MSNKILENIETLTSDITQTTKTKKVNPLHYIIFNESKINIDGKEIQLNTDGWDKICQIFKTGSGSLIAKRLTALMYRLDKLQLQTPQSKTPKSKTPKSKTPDTSESNTTESNTT